MWTFIWNPSNHYAGYWNVFHDIGRRKRSYLKQLCNTTRQKSILEGVVQLRLTQLDLLIGSLEGYRDARKRKAVRIGFSYDEQSIDASIFA